MPDWLTNVLSCAIIFRKRINKSSSRHVLTALQFHISLRQMISVYSKVFTSYRTKDKTTNYYFF